MAKSEIGKIPCQCCGEMASVREQKNGRAYVMCNSPVCGYQGFTRSSGANESMRQKMTPAAQAETPPAAAPESETPPKKKGFFDVL